MAVTFHSKITVRPGSVFCFGTISSVADEEGILHRIADPPEKKSPPTNSENAGKTQPLALRKKIVFGKAGAESSPTRKTPLSTSPTKEWTQITRKKETREEQVVLSIPPASKENRKKVATTAAPFYPDVLFIGRVESPPSLTTNQPCPEKNHLNENPDDGGIDAGTFDDITRPENGIRSSLSRETRSRR
jgi:ADP-heptose:LPS heptosyltransferase